MNTEWKSLKGQANQRQSLRCTVTLLLRATGTSGGSRLLLQVSQHHLPPPTTTLHLDADPPCYRSPFTCTAQGLALIPVRSCAQRPLRQDAAADSQLHPGLANVAQSSAAGSGCEVTPTQRLMSTHPFLHMYTIVNKTGQWGPAVSYNMFPKHYHAKECCVQGAYISIS